MSTPPAPSVADPDGITLLREALANAGYTAARVADAVHAEDGIAPEPPYVPAVVRLLPEGAPLTTLLKLFVLSLDVPVDEAAAALAPLTIDRAEAMDLLAVDDGSARSWHRLMPTASLILASDTPAPADRGVQVDFVMSQSISTRNLTNVTLRYPVATALDIGTGNGIQALLAARHAGTVTAIDASPRAIAFAAFNAQLNGITNIELIEGSFFEPVAGRAFDLIVANPPFVVSPDTTYLYHDSPFGRDELSRMMVQEAAAHLTDGGRAHIEAAWIHSPEGDWSEPLRQWTSDLGCDAWFLRFLKNEPVGYAVTWNTPLQSDPKAHAAAVTRWLDYFEAEGIEAISSGVITLRKRSGPTWARADSAMGHKFGPAEEHVRRVFDNADALEALAEPSALLDVRLVLNPSHRLEQGLRSTNGSFEVERAVLILEDGIALGAAVGAWSAHLIATFDGTRTLRDSIAMSVDALGEDDLDDDLIAQTVEAVSQMVRMGLVSPA